MQQFIQEMPVSQTKAALSLMLSFCPLFLSLRQKKKRGGFMPSHGTEDVSSFSNSFGLQSHTLHLPSGLCPTDIVSQVCAYVTSDLVSFLGFGQSPCLPTSRGQTCHTWALLGLSTPTGLGIYPQPSPMSMMTCSTEDPWLLLVLSSTNMNQESPT